MGGTGLAVKNKQKKSEIIYCPKTRSEPLAREKRVWIQIFNFTLRSDKLTRSLLRGKVGPSDICLPKVVWVSVGLPLQQTPGSPCSVSRCQSCFQAGTVEAWKNDFISSLNSKHLWFCECGLSCVFCYIGSRGGMLARSRLSLCKSTLSLYYVHESQAVSMPTFRSIVSSSLRGVLFQRASLRAEFSTLCILEVRKKRSEREGESDKHI